MNIPVLIESMPGNGFRVRGGEPFAIVVEGSTREAALDQFRQCVSAKLQEGAQVATVEIQTADHPWITFSGMYSASDPVVQDWLGAVAESRDSVEGS